HAYDLVTDKEQASQASQLRLKLMFDRMAQTAQKNNLPVLLGEWGAFYSGEDEKMVPVAHENLKLIEQHHFSQTYWSYFPELGKQPYLREVLLRPVPVAVAGQLQTYRRAENSLRLSWQEDPGITAPTQIFLPQKYKQQNIKVEVRKATQWYLNQTAVGTWLEIDPLGQKRVQSVAVHY